MKGNWKNLSLGNASCTNAYIFELFDIQDRTHSFCPLLWEAVVRCCQILQYPHYYWHLQHRFNWNTSLSLGHKWDLRIFKEIRRAVLENPETKDQYNFQQWTKHSSIVLMRFIEETMFDRGCWKRLFKAVKTKIQTKKRTLQSELKRNGKLEQSGTYIC